MKKEYITPNMEITEFDTEDVIVTSPTGAPETPVTPVFPPDPTNP